MTLSITDLDLGGLKLITPQVFRDQRGYFFESYSKPAYESLGVSEFAQDNYSVSEFGVFRGMHYQLPPGQAKLVRCARGQIIDFMLDIRHGSPTFGQWASVPLDDEKHQQVFVPVGFAHGFLAVSQEAVVEYKCSTVYDARLERTLAWDDEMIGIKGAIWSLGVSAPIVSARDCQGESLMAFTERAMERFPYAPPASP